MDDRLSAIAEHHGVAYAYEASGGGRVEVPDRTVVDVLGLLGVDAGTPDAVERAYAGAMAADDREHLPPTLVLTEGTSRVVTAGGEIVCEDGTTRTFTTRIPDDLPLGWHRITAGVQEATLVVVPATLPPVPRGWGWTLQLYGLRSANSWGMGDFGDLAVFARYAATNGADFLLLNPLHAPMPTTPVPPSPYAPSSRRFTNPLYLSVTATTAYQRADLELRKRVDALRPDRRALIDYDEVRQAKMAALDLLYATTDPPTCTDAALVSFATYNAIAERHGPDWRTWPDGLRRPDGPAVAAFRDTAQDRVRFHIWLQELCREQLAAASAAATDAGMSIGIVQDLAVGVDPGGADAWALADVIADAVRIGAPPDVFNQHGQDWGLAAWHPARLAETGYAAYRDLLRRVLHGASGLRVDHVAGLWRLWWIGPGAGAADGTYVRYDAEAMAGILALEALRAGAVVVGEDLGTVPPEVTDGLRQRGMLGSTVLWFARDFTETPAPFTPWRRWPALALGSVSTHDLPTAVGFLRGEHVRVRAELGQLVHDVAREQAAADTDRRMLLDFLRARAVRDEDAVVRMMHRGLAASPSRLVAASLYDVLGEVRQPNLPGTVDEYPNWRIPLPLSLEDIVADRRVARISMIFTAVRRRSTTPEGTRRTTLPVGQR
jgi:4-alpha-glucanotransferase